MFLVFKKKIYWAVELKIAVFLITLAITRSRALDGIIRLF